MEKEKINNITLQACVEDFLNTNNHKLFERYFNENIIEKKRKFARKLYDYLLELDVGPENLFLLKPLAWHNCDYKILDEEPNEFITSNNNCKNLQYTDDSIRVWRDYTKDTFPSAEAIIQLGIALCLSIEEVNELLYLSDKRTLYAPSLSDYVCIFYLQKNHYQKNKMIFSKQEMRNRIKEAKGKYNEIVNRIKTMEETSFIIDDKHSSNILYSERLEVTSEEMAYVDNKRKSNHHKEENYYNVLTNICISATKNNVFDDAEYFSDKNLYNLFKCHWGFNLRTKMYIDNMQRYQNKYFIRRQLNPISQCDRNELLASCKIECKFEDYFNQLCTRESSKKHFSIQKGLLDAVLQPEKEQLYIEDYRGDRHYINSLLWGNNRAYQEDGRIYRDPKNEEKHGNYYQEHQSKTDALKMAIVSGNEDDLQEYMLLGGFWPKRIYYSGQIEKTEACIKEQRLHGEDLIIVYALLCKEILIDHWTQYHQLNYMEKRKVVYEFPFLELYYRIANQIFHYDNKKDYEDADKYKYIFESVK